MWGRHTCPGARAGRSRAETECGGGGMKGAAQGGGGQTPWGAHRPLALGFHLNNQLTQALTSRYRDSRLRVDFERFVSCAAQLTCIFREYCLWEAGGVGWTDSHVPRWGGGHSTRLLCAGHCSRHLDGGEGVVCLTRRQVSWGWGAQGGQAGVPGEPCLKPGVFSLPVDGGGHLLVGSPHGNPAARGEALPGAHSPCPAWTGLCSTGRGSEPHRPLYLGLLLCCPRSRRGGKIWSYHSARRVPASVLRPPHL